MRSITIIFLLFLTTLNVQAQVSSSSTLLKIEDEAHSVADFLEVLDKKADTGDDLNLEDQIDLFINYQLKVKEALDLRLDTLSDFQEEFKRYRDQIADNYIANGKVTDALVEETYDRLKTEVKASHILIKVPDTASANKRRELLDKARDVAGKARRGADFESLALQYSEDPSAQKNKGNLGWFRAFQMVYPFESKAYELEKGEISSPVETPYGYHIIKKTGERPSQGKIRVAHIMITSKKQDSTALSPKQKIQNIYDRLQNGEDFSSIAKAESDDKRTAPKGGKLNPFAVGDINSDAFEEAAFSLENGEISKPIRSRFGWHVIKKLGNEPVPPLAEKKAELVKRIKTSDRVKLLNDKIQENILEYHEMQVDSSVVDKLAQSVDSTVYRYKWKAPEDLKSSEDIFLSIDTLSYSLGDLARYFQKQQRTLTRNAQYSNMVEEALGKFVYAKLVKHHKDQLEEIAPDFRDKMQGYKEGLMVFELMEREVWDKAKKDSTALKEHYQQHKEKYLSKPKISGLLVDARGIKDLKKLKEQVASTDSIALLKKQFLSIEVIRMDKHPINDSRLPEGLKIRENRTKIYRKEGPAKVVRIDEHHPEEQLSFEKARGKVVADLQEKMEKDFVKRLRKKYKVEMEDEVLKELKERL